MKRRQNSGHVKFSALVITSFAVCIALSTGVASAGVHATGGNATRVPLRQPANSQANELPPGLNVAIGEPVTLNTGTNAATLSNAVDGDASTVWYPVNSSSSTFTVDLGKLRDLSGIGITWAGDTTGARFQVELSRNGKNWFSASGQKKQQSIAIQSMIQYLHFNKKFAEARYARLTLIPGNQQQHLGVAEFRTFSPARGQSSKMILGDDLSTMAQESAIGTTYSMDGKVQPLLSILKSGGTNYIRLRLWVNPPGGVDDLKSDLAMAKKIKAAGLGLFLDIHYSDFWADPSKQITPQSWQGEDLSELSQTVEQYTKSVIQQFAAQGTPVDMVSIGNEVTDGMLWPVGKLYLPDGTQQWGAFTTLLKSGIQGARAGNPAGHTLKVMIHIDRGGDNGGAEWFLDHILAQGVQFDVIGLSYYPWWHGPIANFKNNVDALAKKYNKDIVVAETQYPWTLGNGDSLANQVTASTKLPAGYPATPAGQASYVRDIASIVANIPNHHGLGMFYWEPAWLPGVGWEPGAGTSADNLTEFNWQGQALPAVDAYQIQWPRPARRQVQGPKGRHAGSK